MAEKLPLMNDAFSLNPESPDEKGDNDLETRFNKSLRRLDLLLFLLGFEQSSIHTFVASWLSFLVLGVFLPLIMIQFPGCSGCEVGQIQGFETGIVAAQACMAAAALICISHNLRKYGSRKFLFVDRENGHSERFTEQYTQKISDFIRLLLMLLIPCLLLKIAREIMRFMHIGGRSPWLSAGILLCLIVSWTFVTTIIFSASVLFYLVCSLQIIHLDDYGKLLEREENVSELLQEHSRLRYHLYKISHRFRLYLITQFLIVTVVQFINLVKTTEFEVTFINGGDYVVSLIVQVIVIILCLNAASKITHRAQGIGAMATRWHAFMTANGSSGSSWRNPTGTGEWEYDGSGSDSGWLDSDASSSSSSSAQLTPDIPSYHKRLALVMYLRENPGGVTIFGWAVDRGLINTIFFLELSLVTFVLGKTVVTQ